MVEAVGVLYLALAGKYPLKCGVVVVAVLMAVIRYVGKSVGNVDGADVAGSAG